MIHLIANRRGEWAFLRLETLDARPVIGTVRGCAGTLVGLQTFHAGSIRVAMRESTGAIRVEVTRSGVLSARVIDADESVIAGSFVGDADLGARRRCCRTANLRIRSGAGHDGR
jgi:hypothetical protein